MLQGTGSDVGKSVLVAGLCRALKNRGKVVLPFKPQNMSNNAAVTNDGGEIGRAQALQAIAAKVSPSVDMNPVLLKPQSEIGAQVIVQGRVLGNYRAEKYHELKPLLLEKVLESFAIIGKNADIVMVEGAGSPAEINLRSGDIANMGFAEAANLPVILVADINRGGVIASIVGTHAVLAPSEKKRIKGFMINKFRGDKSLFEDGVSFIEKATGWMCLGVIPYLTEVGRLPKEDAMELDSLHSKRPKDKKIKISVPRLSRIANFDDLDPLSIEPDVVIEIVDPNQVISADTDIILIPGSKSTISDLQFLRETGWDIDILGHHRRGGLILGVCGGFQILGTEIEDPQGIEGPLGKAKGLGLLDVKTTINGKKTLKRVRGNDLYSGENISGYEMHIGVTKGPALNRPWLSLEEGRKEGVMSEDGLVMGTYIHGLFESDGFRRAFLRRFRDGKVQLNSYENLLENTLDMLAERLEDHIEMDKLMSLLWR